MDNSRYDGPSKEYLAYHEAHPDYNVLQDGHDASAWDDPISLRNKANKIKGDYVKSVCITEGWYKTIATTDHQVPTRDASSLRMRSYRPASVDPSTPLPAYLYFHGGGMMFGSIDTEEWACRMMSTRTGFQILHPNYRHTPEHTHPTAVNDAWDVFQWVVVNAETLHIDPSNLVVGGVSAGGCLTAGVVFQEVAAARDERRPVRVKGQLLIIPWLVHRDVYPYELFASRGKSSFVACQDTSILPAAVYNKFTDLLDVKDPTDKLMNIGLASEAELQGMPPTAFMVGGWDMLRDEAFIYADKLENLGVPTKKHIFTGLPHGFRKWPGLESNDRYDGLIVECLQWLVNQDGQTSVDKKGEWKEEIPEKYK